MDRDAQLTIVLGFNGTGKTTTLEDILKTSRRRCLVITPHDREWVHYPHNDLKSKEDFLWQGITRHIFDPTRTLGTLSKIKYLKDCILVFDDCRAYFRASTTVEIQQLIISRRQNMIDIFAVGHGFTQVPPVFFTFASDIILFRTRDNILKRKDCLINFDQMVELQKKVNNEALTNPHYKIHVKL